MRNTTRLIAASALSIPVFLGAAGLASADPDVSYESGTSVAGEDGAGSHQVQSGTWNGFTYFHESAEWADDNGAWAESVWAVTGHGFTGYGEHEAYAGEDGAYEDHTESSVHDD